MNLFDLYVYKTVSMGHYQIPDPAQQLMNYNPNQSIACTPYGVHQGNFLQS